MLLSSVEPQDWTSLALIRVPFGLPPLSTFIPTTSATPRSCASATFRLM